MYGTERPEMTIVQKFYVYRYRGCEGLWGVPGFCVQRDNTLVFWTIQIRKSTFIFSLHFDSPAEFNIIQIVAIVWLCGMMLNDVELTFISVKHLSIRQRVLFSDVNSDVAWVIWPPCSALSCWTRVCPHSCLKNCVVFFFFFFFFLPAIWLEYF